MRTKSAALHLKSPLTPSELKHIVDSVTSWLMVSGIQNDGEEAKIRGSFNAWYEEDTGIYPFVYSEVTGYLVTLMCYLWDKTKKEEYLHRAGMAGDWLLETTHEPNGGFRCLYPLQPSQFDFKRHQMYAFDNGIVLNALMNLYRATKQEKYLASAVTAADWLVYSAQKSNGAFYPIYQLDDDKFFESDKEWSMCSGSYHAKIAIGLLNLYELTHKRKYCDAAIRVCDFAVGCQEANGRFTSFLSRGGTNAHPHCYTAEGLWVAGKYLQREDYLQSSARGMQWLLDLQSPEGFIPRLFVDSTPIYNERVDAFCQTVRLGILHLVDGRLPDSYLEGIHRLLLLMPEYQATNIDPRVAGGFYFGRASNGRIIRHVNSWVSAFAVQALNVFRDYCGGSLDLNPFLLV